MGAAFSWLMPNAESTPKKDRPSTNVHEESNKDDDVEPQGYQIDDNEVNWQETPDGETKYARFFLFIYFYLFIFGFGTFGRSKGLYNNALPVVRCSRCRRH